VRFVAHVVDPTPRWWGQACERAITLFVTETTAREVASEDRQRDLLLAYRNAKYHARRAKRRAQKAHSRMCRLAFLCGAWVKPT